MKPQAISRKRQGIRSEAMTSMKVPRAMMRNLAADFRLMRLCYWITRNGGQSWKI